jgi:hypothetical protein
MGALLRFHAGLFFLFHYGFMHCIYFLFMRMNLVGEDIPIPSKMIIFYAFLFLSQQLISFFRRSPQKRTVRFTFKKFMFFPYARVFPMHFTMFIVFILEILFVSGTIPFSLQRYRTPVLLLFLVLKTIADAAMQVKEQRFFIEPNVKT